MKTHLFFLNLLAAVWLVLFAPAAVYLNASHSIKNLQKLKKEGVIDPAKLQSFAQKLAKPSLATHDQHFENWLNDSSYTNYLLVFPAFMVFLLNALVLLRPVIQSTQST